MLSIRPTGSNDKNPDFRRVTRDGDEDNLRWLARNAPGDDRACLLLLGGASAVDIRVRVAQSHARHDMTPSHWSHVALLDCPGNELARAGEQAPQTLEISLQPQTGFGYPPMTNAVQRGSLLRYQDRSIWPNVAIIYVPLDVAAVREKVERFHYQRAAVDTVGLLVDWLAFVWGVGRSVNPLLDGRGLPSATMVEYVTGALQFELTPGLDSRSSCPEAIWQAAMWWHNYYTEAGGQKLEGAWVVDHGLVDNRMRVI